MQYFLEDFIDQTNAAASNEILFSLYTNALGRLGFDRTVYTFLTDFPALGKRAGHGIEYSYPEDWVRYYKEHGYGRIDPVVLNVLRGRPVFTWDSLHTMMRMSASQTLLMRQGKEAGLHDGVGVTLHGVDGSLAAVGIASSAGGVAPDKNMLSRIKLMTEQFHLAYCDLNLQQETPESALPSLTTREIETLKWWAQGKTSQEISVIRGCTVATVKFHAKNIYAKLHANSKTLCVAKAIKLGFIPLDIIQS
ncbi:MAG TPA: LuxR family transcriptional regulator [Rickettsiales bacterium]|nr:LuxR family transcriptional regulator [Rickettsiales bacterium]